MSLTLKQLNMHCITSANGNVLVRVVLPNHKEIFFKISQLGKHLKHKGELFTLKKEYEAAKADWRQKETPLPGKFKEYAEAIIKKYEDQAPVVKKKQKEPEAQTT